MRAALYARVSNEEQVQGYSLDAQLDAMRRHCLQMGWQAVAEFVEPGASARTVQRTQFQAMIAQARAHAFDILLVHKLDRVSRNREDAVIYKGLLRREGIQVVSVTEPNDGSPAGKLQEGMLEIFAEWFSANLAQETRKGHFTTSAQRPVREPPTLWILNDRNRDRCRCA